MPRAKKTIEQLKAEPLKPKKSKIAKIIEQTGMTTAAELAPPEIITPEPDRPRTFAEKIRGPKRRMNGEPSVPFTSKDLRIEKDGYSYQVRSERDLTGEERDFIAHQGLYAVDDDERIWNGTQREINAVDGDINQIANRIGKAKVRSI